MFKSIKWRLTISFISITFLTALVIGSLSYMLMDQYVQSQQQEILESNAVVVAQQAKSLMWPIVQVSDLQSLVSTMSYLGNVRVRVLDMNDRILADSGSVPQSYQFLWILPSNFADPDRDMRSGYRTMILPILETEYMGNIEEIFSRYELPSGVAFRVIRRDLIPWGSQIEFQADLQRLSTELIESDGQMVKEPIVESGLNLGYVEVFGSPGIGEETLKTTLSVIILATIGAVLLSGLAGFVISRQLSRPINQLSDAATKMSDGDLTIRAPEKSSGEIGNLSRQFNTMADSLKTSFEKLEKERDTLRRFVADASHELRTPITALKSFNDLLTRESIKDPKKTKEFLLDSKIQIERLEWLTDNLLNLSRLDAGIRELNCTEEDINPILEKVSTPFKVYSQERDIDFNVCLYPEPLLVNLDRAMIELALNNLLDNAFKYTSGKNGKIELGVRRSMNSLEIWVEDNGMGIAETDLPYIFDRFYRSKNINIKGSGLGLAIVKSVADIHGGQVQVRSELDKGSRFFLSLPMGANRI